MLFKVDTARDAGCTLAGLVRGWDGGVILVEDHGNLFERVSTRLRIVEVGGQQEGDEDDDEDDIVLPSDAGQRDWVDEGVEEYGNNCRAPRHGEPTASHVEWPDLAGERGQHRGSAVDTVSLGFRGLGSMAFQVS